MTTYASIPDPVLIECAPLHHVRLQAVIDLGHELECEGLYRSVSINVLLESPRSYIVTFRIVVAGMQCVSRSYSFARTCKILAGDRSSIISFAMTSMSASQSGGGMGVFSEI